MKSNSLVRNIHIGNIITNVILEKKLTDKELSFKLKISIDEINKQLTSNTMDTITLLKWSRALRYDFFRLYSSHLMLHHGISNSISKKALNIDIKGIQIRKNVYTKEMIFFLVNKVKSNEMKPMQVIDKYGIPKTTFYKWLLKFSDDE